MTVQETLYAMALTRLGGTGTTALQFYQKAGSAQAVYENRNNIRDVVPDASDRLLRAFRDWDPALKRAEQELEFMLNKRISCLCIADAKYPQRLAQCEDAPLVLYYAGRADLNVRRIIAVVGTRHATVYGNDCIRRLIAALKDCSPETLVVSGLAYGADICAHRESLRHGFKTVGVLAHGLDTLYPSSHRDTANEMVEQGGLLTEYMSHTPADKQNFVRRNRIVAGMSDATIVVESAAHGGSLITARIAQDYNREVFAFPGAVTAEYSQGCNNLIRDNGARLITSAEDLVQAMRWDDEQTLMRKKAAGIERSLFPNLTPEEQAVVDVLAQTDMLKADMLAVQTDMPISRITSLMFELEMKGVVKLYAGGVYHLL